MVTLNEYLINLFMTIQCFDLWVHNTFSVSENEEINRRVLVVVC